VRRTLFTLLVATGCVLSGCSSSSKSSNPKIVTTDLRGNTSVTVTVKDNVFDPPGIRIDSGTRVTFVNSGRSAHNILLGDPNLAYDTSVGVNAAKFAPGASYSYTFTRSGVYSIFCSLHGTPTAGMIGAIVVGDAQFDGHITSTEGNGTKSGTLRVPADYRTIQEAVNAAEPGSLVLVAPGIYRESVTVSNPRIVIRGEERATTIVDGEFVRDNGFKVVADGVVVENMTARNFTKNGFFWTGVKGYRGSYLTAVRNGDYGIYAFDAINGQFDHDYGAGSPDAGFYIGQCFPCNAVITDSFSEWNGIGYSGTNAGGNLLIVNSIWRNNRVGIVPNSGTGEANPPQREATIVGNIVYGNNNAKSAAIDIAQTAIGNGILVAGGDDDTVERNLVYDHDIAGIGVITLPEKVLSPDDKKAQNFDARRNTVRDNITRDDRVADLLLVTTLTDAKDAGGNCFSGNQFRTSLPPNLEHLVPCGSAPSPSFTADIGRFAAVFTAEKPKGADYKVVRLPAPPLLEDMPNAANAPAHPADQNVPMHIDLSAITVPAQ
jgi:plastocyanin